MLEIYYRLCRVLPLGELRCAELLRGLSPERRVRYAAFSDPKALERSLWGDLLAREQAARLLGGCAQDYRLTDGSSGEPLLPGSGIFLSVTHSGELVAAAAARRPVGVDLERMRPLSQALLRRFCSVEERQWLQSDALRRGLRLWTMKEASSKHLGKGLLQTPLFFAGFDGDRLITEYPDRRFLFPDAPEGYLLSICLSRDNSQKDGDTCQ